MTDAEVAAAMDVARANGVRVCAHARSADSVKMCLRHGLGIIYHANFADEEALDQLEANRDWCFVVPALGLPYQACHAGSEWGFTPEMPRARPPAAARDLRRDDAAGMRKRGIRVLPGGDYGFAWNPHGTYARDLLLFVDVLGFTPMETLVAATRLGGEIMGRPDELGQVKPGYLADLLLVDGDPLADIKRLQDRDALLDDHEGRPAAQSPGVMKRSTERILTTHTGSLPRPKDLLGLLAGSRRRPARATRPPFTTGRARRCSTS